MKSIRIDKYSFKFEDIDIIYPVYLRSIKTSDKYYNFRSSVSTSKYSRNHQLSSRSNQSKLFDTLIGLGYFSNICDEIIPEVPIVNTDLENEGNYSYYLLDYFIPSKSLAIELDSDLHNLEHDRLKDKFLNSIGIKVYRVKNLMSNSVQKILGIVNAIKSTPNNQFSIDYSECIHDKIEFDRVQNENRKEGINGLFKKSRERIDILSKMYDANIIKNIESKSIARDLEGIK